MKPREKIEKQIEEMAEEKYSYSVGSQSAMLERDGDKVTFLIGSAATLDLIEKEFVLVEREVLLEAIPYVEMTIPEPSHFGSCSPETICDMDCSHAFHGALLLTKLQKAIEE